MNTIKKCDRFVDCDGKILSLGALVITRTGRKGIVAELPSSMHVEEIGVLMSDSRSISSFEPGGIGLLENQLAPPTELCWADPDDSRATVTLKPIPMLLTCPSCGKRHIDRGEFATKPHHTHACQHCGMCWRPAVVDTVGVEFLPGFKDPDHPVKSNANDEGDQEQ